MNDIKTKNIDDNLKAIFDRSFEDRVSHQVKPLAAEAEIFDKSLSLDEVLVKTIDIILDNNSYYNTEELDIHLQRVFELQKEIFDSIDIENNLKKRRFISKSGNIISPEHCIHTIKDTLRVRAYIRSIHLALEDIIKKNENEPISIVYPACGPFAPLLLPLINKYKQNSDYSNKLKIILIDIQKGATHTLKALIEKLGIENFIEDIYEMDALDYYPKNGKKFDMVILEAINHGFTKEGHLQLSKHFMPLLKEGGIFIPQEVIVKAFLNSPQEEYVEQWKDVKGSRELYKKDEIIKQRTELGDILTITQNNIKNLKEVPSTDPSINLIECATLKIPTPIGKFDKQYLLFSVYLNLYKDEKLGEYDSGISHPFPMINFCLNYKPNQIEEDDILVKSGEIVTFYYRLDGLPSFIPFKKKEFNR